MERSGERHDPDFFLLVGLRSSFCAISMTRAISFMDGFVHLVFQWLFELMDEKIEHYRVGFDTFIEAKVEVFFESLSNLYGYIVEQSLNHIKGRVVFIHFELPLVTHLLNQLNINKSGIKWG